ncbi:MAG: hypothetical protein ACYS0K_23155 [Planctomycetota bacterium]
MKRLACFLLVVILGSASGAWLLGLAPNRMAEDGPADPLLELRRPVMAFLSWAGLAPTHGLFRPSPWLPYSEKWRWWFEDQLREKTELTKEPVYRSLFWPVGDRISVRSLSFGENAQRCGALRLCYVEDGRKVVAGTGTGGPDARVSGFVPRSASGLLVEEMKGNGEVLRRLWTWGEVETH